MAQEGLFFKEQDMLRTTTMTMAFVAVIAAGGMCFGEEEKKEDKFAFSAYADFYSKYIFRGVNCSDESVFQPAVYVSRWGFTGSVWGNMDLKNVNDKAGVFSELDYTIDYTATVPGIDWLNFSVGNAYYEYPNTDVASTDEVYGGMSMGCTCSGKGECLACLIAPSFKIYRDIDASKGTYGQLSIGHTIQKFAPITEGCMCDFVVGASVGYANDPYNKGNFDVEGSKLNDLTLSLALPFNLSGVTIKPGINYSSMLDSEIREATEKSDNLWGGVSLSYSF
jgi:hypothetical protein